MKIYQIVYTVIEMLLFVGASIFVTNNYIKDSEPLTMAFGCFLILVFISQVMVTAKRDASKQVSE